MCKRGYSSALWQQSAAQWDAVQCSVARALPGRLARMLHAD